MLSASLAIFHASAVHIIHVLHVEGFAALIAPALFALAVELGYFARILRVDGAVDIRQQPVLAGS